MRSFNYVNHVALHSTELQLVVRFRPKLIYGQAQLRCHWWRASFNWFHCEKIPSFWKVELFSVLFKSSQTSMAHCFCSSFCNYTYRATDVGNSNYTPSQMFIAYLPSVRSEWKIILKFPSVNFSSLKDGSQMNGQNIWNSFCDVSACKVVLYYESTRRR